MFHVAWLVMLSLAAAAQGEPRKEMEELQGTWKLISTEIKGSARLTPADITQQVIIKGDRYVTLAKDKNGNEYRTEVILKVDASKSPRTIDFVPIEKADKVKPTVGIYELKGNELRICFSSNRDDERPKAFTTKGKDQLRLITLRKVP